jgi:hypothetical protein
MSMTTWCVMISLYNDASYVRGVLFAALFDVRYHILLEEQLWDPRWAIVLGWRVEAGR